MAIILAATAFALLHGSATYGHPALMPDLASQLREFNIVFIMHLHTYARFVDGTAAAYLTPADFKAGEEPHRARHERGPGQARLCSPGHFKATAGQTYMPAVQTLSVHLPQLGFAIR
jgi:hypothetical protein